MSSHILLICFLASFFPNAESTRTKRGNELNLTIAAIRSGTDPVGKLPEAAFHRWLETPLGCPKCDVSYNLVVDWEQATSRWFELFILTLNGRRVELAGYDHFR